MQNAMLIIHLSLGFCILMLGFMLLVIVVFVLYFYCICFACFINRIGVETIVSLIFKDSSARDCFWVGFERNLLDTVDKITLLFLCEVYIILENIGFRKRLTFILFFFYWRKIYLQVLRG